MNCTTCTWPKLALCDEAECIGCSPEHGAVIALACLGALHSGHWWRKVSCRIDGDGALIVPNKGMALLYALVHVLGAIAMVLIATSAVAMNDAQNAEAYRERNGDWIAGVAARWSCAAVFEWCCEARRRERVEQGDE